MMAFGEWSRGLRSLSALRPYELIAARSVTSTNELARRCVDGLQAEDGAFAPLLFLAWEQTEGRGRHGRTWVSPAGGGVYATVAVRLDAAQLGGLPLRVAVALGLELRRWAGERCRLKWPNDLQVDGRKIGGILIDAVHRGGAPWVFVGFGVNLSQPAVEMEGPGATGLTAVCPDPPNLVELAGALSVAVLDTVRSPVSLGRVLGAYRRMSVHEPGQILRCCLPDRAVQGVFRGIDDEGRLRLEVAGQLLQLVAGEVVAG